MMMPSILGESLFDDDWMDFPRRRPGRPPHGPAPDRMMRTDVKENKDSYEIAMDLPGFKKEDVSVELENGYLTVSASKTMNNDQQDSDGRYIRRERFAGRAQRSFYVGDDVTEEDVKARFEDGILKLCILKKDQPTVEKKKTILIEG